MKSILFLIALLISIPSFGQEDTAYKEAFTINDTLYIEGESEFMWVQFNVDSLPPDTTYLITPMWFKKPNDEDTIILLRKIPIRK